MNTIRPNQERAGYAILFAKISLLSYFANIGLAFFLYKSTSGVLDSGAIDDHYVIFIKMYAVVNIISLIIFVLFIIFFLQWFRRAYFNLHMLTPNLKFTEGWAAGSWFIPFINWVWPYQIMMEIIKKTRELFSAHNIYEHSLPKPSSVKLWWLLYMVHIAIAILWGILDFVTSDLDMIGISSITEIIYNIFAMMSVLVLIKIIRQYSQNETLLKNINSGKINELIIDDNEEILY